jgi:prepilin-type N-terminal cleavage/methylation domain-containing protein/prepilin-type processing-associated H-X9-DG protein
MRRKRAFTLIELLVVIAIIAILAAILFPVFAKAREKARETSCLSNCKQMGLGIVQYVQDYDEHYPGRAMNAEQFSWRVTTTPYVKNHQVFMCPSNPNNGWTALDGTYPVSYGCNGWDQVSTVMHWNGGVAMSACLSPAQLVLICESCQQWSEMNLDYCVAWTQAPNGKGGLFEGHMGEGNIAFADGHAKSMHCSTTEADAGPLNLWDTNGPYTVPFNDGNGDTVVQLTQDNASWQ